VKRHLFSLRRTYSCLCVCVSVCVVTCATWSLYCMYSEMSEREREDVEVIIFCIARDVSYNEIMS
jgi:hypothetical protein